MLARFERVVLLLDNDEAGRRAAEHIAGTLGERAVVVSLPGVKDVAELATQSDGLTIFLQAARGTDHLAAA